MNSATVPFFVLGAQRSGTTMLRLMINNHPNLAVPHETGFITVFQQRLGEYGDLTEASNVARLLDDISEYHLVRRGRHVVDKQKILAHPIASYADLIDAILTEYAHSQGKTRWGDKTPFYTPDIDVLWKLFPNCKIIHLVRDGRDSALSQLRMEWMSNSVPRLAEQWRWKTMICHKVGSVLGDAHFLELRYEDLVADPEAILRRICGFLGETFDARMLAHEESADSVVPDESRKWHEHSVKAPDRSKLYGWKRNMSPADRIIFEQVAGDALAQFGYELAGSRSTIGSKLKSLYYATLRRW